VVLGLGHGCRLDLKHRKRTSSQTITYQNGRTEPRSHVWHGIRFYGGGRETGKTPRS
jgi:hypothetical protein